MEPPDDVRSHEGIAPENSPYREASSDTVEALMETIRVLKNRRQTSPQREEWYQRALDDAGALPSTVLDALAGQGTLVEGTPASAEQQTLRRRRWRFWSR